MSSKNISNVDTKTKAYNLINDPTILLDLIYSKYGDVEEDFNLLYINQLVYDKSTKYNIFFKEYILMNDSEEYLKRYYRNYETKTRIPKLSDYYKNYHLFFCRPNFKDLIISDLMENYGDDKAEIFYKKNFESTNEDKDSENKNSDSMSSLDNITDNKIIFTKKTKKIIDKDLDPNYGTLTLSNNSNLTGKNADGLISARSKNDSFEKIVHNLICYKKSKKIYDKNKNKKINQTKKNDNINNNVVKNNKKINAYKKQHTNTNSNDNIINNHKIKIDDSNMKKINKNIIHISNINNHNISHNNKNQRNKTSLFSLLKANNLINYAKTDNNINKNINNRIQNNLTITINLTKPKNINQNKTHKNKNNNGNNALFSSPKVNKEYITTKYEEFHTNIKSRNTPFYHKKNKTEYFTNNHIASLTNTNKDNSNNIIINNNKQEKIMKNNYISKILTKKVNSRNYQESLKNLNLNYRPNNKFNNFFTISNNNILDTKQKLNNNMVRNKTFEEENLNNEMMNKVNNLKENLKIYKKNKINHQINNSTNNKKFLSNKIIIKKNYISNTMGSKFNLIKSPLKISHMNKINIKKHPHEINTKISSINNFIKNANHKKSQTTVLSNFFETSSKNNIYSPVNNNSKQFNKLYQINKSESIASKIRPKIENNKINNLNINFNNVIFNGPLSNINENLNFNNNIINNTNFNTNYKLLTPTNNRNSFNNTFSNNNRLSNNLVNIANKNNANISNVNNSNTSNNNGKKINPGTLGKINYITNLKNFSNFSRNKMYSIDKYMNNTEDIYSLVKSTEMKQVKMINNTYTNLNNEQNEIFSKKKRELIIPKNTNKKIDIKNNNKKSSKIKKPKKKIESRNKNIENDLCNYAITQNNLGNNFLFDSSNMELIKIKNGSFKTKDDENANYISLIYLSSSPNTDIRNVGSRPINVNRNSNLMTKKYIKAKPKIKAK